MTDGCSKRLVAFAAILAIIASATAIDPTIPEGEDRLVTIQEDGGGPVSRSSALIGASPVPGEVRYLFHGAVDVGCQSQMYGFTVHPGVTYLPDQSLLTVSVYYDCIGQGSCDLDLSLWDTAGLRTGGAYLDEDLPATRILGSQYAGSPSGTEWVNVSIVSSQNSGLWLAGVQCNLNSSTGATFVIVASLRIEEPIVSGFQSPAYSFTVPSNARALQAGLVHASDVDLDLSLWDGAGRRTGGLTSEESFSSFEIPSSEYVGSSFASETVTVFPVMSSEGDNGGGEVWSFSVRSVSGFSSISHGMLVEMELDSDGDGVADLDDIDPVRDICLRLTVMSLVEEDRIDSGRNAFDPYVRFAIGTHVVNRKPVGGGGDAWVSSEWSRSIKPIVHNGDFEGAYTMWKDIPDDSGIVPLLIQVWDDDGRMKDDICDISPRDGGANEKYQDSSTLHIEFDIASQRWSGDVGGVLSSGTVDGSGDQDDVEMQFTITVDSELPYGDRVFLAQKFAPEILLDGGEESGPLEVWSMLNQSELRQKGTRELIGEFPTDEMDLEARRNDSYIALVTKELDGYAKVIYPRVSTTDNDTVFIQYWFFYLLDSVSPHQGDWEMIQIVFPEGSRWEPVESLIPNSVAYSQHYGREVKTWEDEDVLKEGLHTKVFVELGGHASLFSGSQDVLWECSLCMMTPRPWTVFAGAWGGSEWQPGPGGNSVVGPVYRSSMNRNWLGMPTSVRAFMWHEPLYWMG